MPSNLSGRTILSKTHRQKYWLSFVVKNWQNSLYLSIEREHMKLITLNIWGGHVAEPFAKFIHDHKEVDILCLQEVYQGGAEKINGDDRWVDTSIYEKIVSWMPDHEGYFCPLVSNIYGLATFVRKGIQVEAVGEVPIFDSPAYVGVGADHSRKIQWLRMLDDGTPFTLINLHGLWNGKGKTDCPERIEQSHIVRTFIDSLDTPWALVGDFNLKPGTESLAILDKGSVNWVIEQGIQSTRTSYYPKEERMADYIVTSPGITGSDFAVMPDEVSDHAALAIDFEIN